MIKIHSRQGWRLLEIRQCEKRITSVLPAHNNFIVFYTDKIEKLFFIQRILLHKGVLFYCKLSSFYSI